MAKRTLGELEKSRLLNELALMPGPDKVRITRATDRGEVLEDAHERDIQRAKLAQMPWARWGAALIYGFAALTNWMSVIDGRRSGFWPVLAAVGFSVMCLIQTRRWWILRRLDQKLQRLDEPIATTDDLRDAPTGARASEPDDAPHTI